LSRPTPLRVIIADPNPQVLRAIIPALEQIEGLEIVAALSSPLPINRIVDSLKPDLVISDLEPSGLAGPIPGVRTILLTFYDGAELREIARLSWADAVLCKAKLNQELRAEILRLFPAGD